MDKHNGLHVDTLYLEITDRCNYSCKYCYNRSCASNGHFLSDGAFQKAVTCFTHWGLKTITYSGGEPLLHPELKKFLNYGYNHDIIQLIITNGSMLNDAWCDYIRENGALLQLTMDGSSETINDYTRGKGAYIATIAALERARCYGISDRLIIRYNISHSNQTDIDSFIQFISNYKVRRIEFSLVMPNGRGQEFECIDRIMDVELIREIDQRIAQISASEGVRVSLINSSISLACPIKLGRNGLRVKLDSMGNVYPCQSLFGTEYAVCNVNDDDFDHDFFAKQFDEYARRLDDINYVCKDCLQCHYAKICSGSCIADTVAYVQMGMNRRLCSVRRAACRKELLNRLRERRKDD